MFPSLLLATLMVLSGCTQRLQPDVAVSALEAGYPSAEFRACGKLWVGLGTCRIAPGQSFKDLGIKIQGYYAGTVQIESKACGVSVVRRYGNNELVDVVVPAPAAASCLFTFQVFPDYPGQQTSGVFVSGFKAYLWVRMLPRDQAWHSTEVKDTGSWERNWKMFVGGTQPVSVQALGCDHDFLDTLPVVDGQLVFPLHKAVSAYNSVCVVEGLVVNPAFKNTMFSALVVQHSSRYVKLAIPTMKKYAFTLTVYPDGATAATSIDDRYTTENPAVFEDFHFNVPHILRTITVKGRSVIGLWDPKEYAWTWLQ